MFNIVNEAVENYAEQNTQAEGALLQELSAETWRTMDHPQMLSGRLSGRLLKMLVQLTRAEKILEIGTFTGYTALSMAEALGERGHLWTLEIEKVQADFAKRYFIRSEHGKKITLLLGPALENIKMVPDDLDFVFIDADKVNYDAYYEVSLQKLKRGGLIAIDNMLWSGRVLAPSDPSTLCIHALNEKLSRDERVENVLLTIRDGIQLVRKR